MNSYEEKQERRKERLEARAERLAREGNAKIESGMRRFRAIPFGQPILVGHHSEKRDRNYRAKAWASIDKGMELNKEANEVATRAAAVGTGGISSDDPEAITKLQEKLHGLELEQAHMVAVNKIIRKHKSEGTEAIARALVEWGVAPNVAGRLLSPDYAGRIGYPAYALSNNSGNMARIRGRIEQLQRNATRETKEEEKVVAGLTVRMVENAELNRLQLFFPGKPSAVVRSQLKMNGFRWSPSEGAWQRQLTAVAKHCAAYVLERIERGDLK